MKEILEVGFTEANFEAFNAEGLNTRDNFAFACNYAPGSADERPLTTLATNFLGAAPSKKEMACDRRLFSEAYSIIAADMRSKVEASDEAAVKKLAPAELSQRLCEQQQRLSGLDIRGNFEHCLIRRGRELDQAHIVCFKKREHRAEKLINACMEEAPSGCAIFDAEAG